MSEESKANPKPKLTAKEAKLKILAILNTTEDMLSPEEDQAITAILRQVNDPLKDETEKEIPYEEIDNVLVTAVKRANGTTNVILRSFIWVLTTHLARNGCLSQNNFYRDFVSILRSNIEFKDGDIDEKIFPKKP